MQIAIAKFRAREGFGRVAVGAPPELELNVAL
jgi:hypothetical protein